MQKNIWAQLFGAGDAEGSAVLEEIVEFELEMSVVVARNAKGQIAAFDVVENIHKNHILAITHAPATISEREAARRPSLSRLNIADALNIQGVLAIEMFLTRVRRNPGQ